MASSQSSQALVQVFGQAQSTIAAGSNATLNVRGARGIMVYLNGGTATYQPCNDKGTVVPGSAASDVVGGVLIEANWSHYRITAAGATCTVCII